MDGVLTMNAAAEALNQDAALQQMLTFALENESYGVDIQRVQEIRGWSAVTPIPESPHHVLGVQNLRGTIVPIIDLRARIGMPTVAPSATTVIIVLSVETSQGAKLFGIVVDRVSDVTNLTEASLRAVPTMGNGGSAEYLRGLFSLGDNMILVLDIDKLLSDGGMTF
jgi:purine-binding chemotaxis protein CheW